MSSATQILRNTPSILASASVGGKKESEGPLGEYFDKINDDPYMSTVSWAEISNVPKTSPRRNGWLPNGFDTVF